MIMKANKQIGFIYKDNESIDKILKDGEVVFERGFLREKTSTTLPITFGGVGKDLKDYRVYGNTVQSKLPDGYTQVDYLKSESYTNYFIIPHEESFDNLGCDFKINIESRQGQYGPHIISSIDNKSNFWVVTRPSDLFIRYYMGTNTFSNIYNNTDGIGVDTRIECNIDGTNKVIVNETNIGTLTKGSEVPNTNDIYLLNYPGSLGGNYGFKGKFYYCKLYSNGNLIYDFIPCYRNSDNEVGLYDLVNNVFYTNQGTGTFTYGSVAPTPDAPIEIISCGDRTKNLLNVSNEYSVTTWQEIDVNLQPGDYIVNCTNTSTNVESGKASLMNFYHSDNTYDQLYFNRVDKVGTVTITAETTKVRIYSGSSYTVSNGKTTILTNLMIRKSNISDGTYEPYGKYKIPINVRSDNLFDINTISNIGGGTNNNGIITSATRSTSGTINLNFKFSDILVKAGETLYFSVDIKLNNDSIGTFSNINDNVHAGATKIIYPTLNNKYQRYQTSYTYSNDETVKSMLIQIGNLLGSFEVSNIMISKDDSIIYKSYYNETTNIYLDEPLRRIGEYSDYIDFKNGKVVRNIKEIILGGSENWTRNSTYINAYYIDNFFTDIIQDVNRLMLCDYFTYGGKISSSASIEVGKFYTWTSLLNRLILGTDLFSSVADFKTWLQSNNVTVDYVLATPTEETITLPNIPTIDGNNTLNIETEITPSQVYIKYKSNT